MIKKVIFIVVVILLVFAGYKLLVTKEKNNARIFVEEYTGNTLITGSLGKQMQLVVETESPTTITYALSYESGAAIPNAETKVFSESKTVSVPEGRTILSTFTAINGRVDLEYTVE